jgi:hypothetical protein
MSWKAVNVKLSCRLVTMVVAVTAALDILALCLFCFRWIRTTDFKIHVSPYRSRHITVDTRWGHRQPYHAIC